jgi:hypothetical protein
LVEATIVFMWLAQNEAESPQPECVIFSWQKRATKPHPQPLSKRDGSQKRSLFIFWLEK